MASGEALEFGKGDERCDVRCEFADTRQGASVLSIIQGGGLFTLD
jgi:hypothetical protein